VELIALCHSELSEALEDYRNGRRIDAIYYENDKPSGIPIELADVVIRVFDICGAFNIDLQRAINIKHEYNLKRPYKHGGKVI
jgi:NTP pyrophosphatase (non-canonical NTP hydrolase)